MAKNILPTDYKDDLISESMNGKRRYRLINNPDGTISLEDVTEYEQLGSLYGAKQINSTNQAVNESFDKNKIVRDMDTIQAMTQEGYVPDALALKALNESLNNLSILKKVSGTSGSGGNPGTIIPYPDGYNIDNTFVVSVHAKITSDLYLGVAYQSTVGDYTLSYVLKPDGIGVVGSGTTANQNVELLITKVS